MIAAARSCRGSAGELGSRAMVRAGPLSPDGAERPGEPREPRWSVVSGAGGGVGLAGRADILCVPWERRGPHHRPVLVSEDSSHFRFSGHVCAKRGERKAPPNAGVASGLVTSPPGAGALFVILVSHLCLLCSLLCGLDVMGFVGLASSVS